jgi:Domain of unknown function (DUF4136)
MRKLPPWPPGITRLGWLAVAGTAILACASLGVRTDYDRDVAFGAFRSYAWTDSSRSDQERKSDPFLERRLRRAVDGALRARGFAADSEGTVDFLVTAFVIGPTAEEGRWRYWPAAPCGPVVPWSLGAWYPYGYGLRHPRWPWRSPFYHYPWGYACSYRLGFGYLWVPVYEAPGDRLAGTVVVDILRPDTRELLWRGSLEGAVRYDGEAMSQEELDDIATRILHQFPPDSVR